MTQALDAWLASAIGEFIMGVVKFTITALAIVLMRIIMAVLPIVIIAVLVGATRGCVKGLAKNGIGWRRCTRPREIHPRKKYVIIKIA